MTGHEADIELVLRPLVSILETGVAGPTLGDEGIKEGPVGACQRAAGLIAEDDVSRGDHAVEGLAVSVGLALRVAVVTGQPLGFVDLHLAGVLEGQVGALGGAADLDLPLRRVGPLRTGMDQKRRGT